MAGTCDEANPAMIFATVLLPLLRGVGFFGALGRGPRLRGGFPRRLVVLARLRPVAFDRTSALEHHLGVIVLRGAGHRRGEMPERMTVGRAELGGEIDIAAQLEHPIVVALEYRVGLFGRKIIFLQILGFVRLEGFAVLVLHQRHAEHVDAVALARAFRIENERPRDVLVFVLFGFRLSHRRFSLVASVLRSEISSFPYSSTARLATLRPLAPQRVEALATRSETSYRFPREG